MEDATDPSVLKDRAFYRLGEFTYDHSKKLVIIGVIVCIALSSLMIKGPDWAESWGEGDLESVEARDLFMEIASKSNETGRKRRWKGI